MQCPKCGGKSLVYGGRSHGAVRQRYRRCRICDHRYSTWEEIENRTLRKYERKAVRADLFGELGDKTEGYEDGEKSA